MSRRYHLSIGAGLLPRIGHGTPITLADALDRAAGHYYAVIYRLGEDGNPVPVIAGAGGHEIIHVPSGRRFRRRDIESHPRLTEPELAAANDPRFAAHLAGNSPWFTSWRHARYLATGVPRPAASTLGQRLAESLGWDHVPQLTTEEQEQIDREFDEAPARVRRAYGLDGPGVPPGGQTSA